MEAEQKQPANLSVVVVILKGRDILARCLTALNRQTGNIDFEIIVPHDDSFPNIGDLREQFPRTRFVAVAGYRTYAELRALGVQQSRGSIVALTEDHCLPQPDWCAQIVAEHHMPAAAIGGAVEKQTPDTIINWSFYLADYVRYMNPVPDGPAHNLTDCNVTYKRAALDEITEVWQQEFHEPDVHAALQARNAGLWLSSKIVVYQQRDMSFGAAMKDRYTFGRLFGGGRAASLPLSRRLVLMALAPLFPFLLTVRVAQNIFGKQKHKGAFFKALPMVFLLNSVWAWGEFLGYLTGRAEASLTPGQRSAQNLHGGHKAAR